MEGADKSKTLALPAVTALKEEAATNQSNRGRMERTISEDIRLERDDLKEAAEHNLNVIVDLSMDAKIRWVSPSWQHVIGTDPDTVLEQPISDILVDNKAVFTEAVHSMQQDDSRSKIIRFVVFLGPSSKLAPKSPQLPQGEFLQAGEDQGLSEVKIPQHTVTLEAQGIIVYDRASGGESHVSIRMST